MDKAHMVGRAKRKNTCSNFLFKHCTSLALENDMSRPGDKAYTNSILVYFRFSWVFVYLNGV